MLRSKTVLYLTRFLYANRYPLRSKTLLYLTRFLYANRYPLRSKTLWLIPWLIRGSTCVQNASDIASGFLKFAAYQYRHKKENAGAS